MEQREASRCVHRWILGQAVRGRVHGVCRRCGAERWYPAYFGNFDVQEGERELTAGRPALATGTASLDEHDLGSALPLDGAAVSLSETEPVW